jgi:hypothetical protein
MPAGWTAITNGKDYGTKVESDGSFDFPVAPNSVHYVTGACDSLAGAKGLRLRYRIDADPGVKFLGAKDNQEITVGPFLHFQCGGITWTGEGEDETRRWWPDAAPTLTPGEHEIEALFTDEWGAVETSTNRTHPDAFAAALKDAARVGLTWPNMEGKGHGLYATGNARFTLVDLSVL